MAHVLGATYLRKKFTGIGKGRRTVGVGTPETESTTGGMKLLEGLARFSYRRRWLMLAIWIVALIGFITLGSTVGGSYSTDFSLPGAESQEAFDLLDERFPEVAGETADIVFEAEQGVNNPEVRTTME